ncbi:MAG TPA: MBOAT family O-acyltransferase [Reyranella sp.]|nr:MBOAT family O-acyltransferase [Reyranella sp.]
MVFPTLSFLIFYLVVWPASWAMVLWRKHRLHKLAIIAGSYVFYFSWSTRLASVLFASVLLNWLTGRALDAVKGTKTAKAVVIVGVAINLSVLGFFKYYNFFVDGLNQLLLSLGITREISNLEIILPIGISFFTFQGISYVVDLYRGDLDRARPLIDVMMFISFFAHLIAGPIVRASKFLPQLERPPRRDRVFVSLGVLLIGWGVFKKAVIANWLAVELVDKVFIAPAGFAGADLLFAIYGYAVQIYCDFSAYSDIAIGVAALLGYRFQRNFNQPYRAASLRDFWRRWHISLSTWLRDYLYRPLGGNRKGRVRTYVNLAVTMLLGGLWHGASMNFVIWGGLHGLFLAAERWLDETFPALGKHAGKVTAFIYTLFIFHFVCFCWIFFRAKDMGQVSDVLTGLLDWSQPVQLVTPFILLLLAIGALMHLVPTDLLQRLDRAYHRVPTWGVGVACGLVLLGIELVGGDGTAPFIYFQF